MPRVHLSCLRCSGEICAYERQDVTGKGRWIFRQTWDLDCVPRRKVIQPYIGKKDEKRVCAVNMQTWSKDPKIAMVNGLHRFVSCIAQYETRVWRKNAWRSQHEGCNSKNHHFLQNLTRKCTIAKGSKSDRGSACLSTSHASYGKQEKTCRVEEQLPIASKPKPEWSVGKTLSMWTISIEQTSGKYRHLPAYCFFNDFLPLRTSKTRNICHQTQGDTTI